MNIPIDSDARQPELMRLSSLSKKYGSTQAIHDLDLQIRRGDYLAITGPSGSGKSTLLGILGLLESPNKGSYELEGQNVVALRDGQAARLRNERFGFIFQQFHLLPKLTALENAVRPLMIAGMRKQERLDIGKQLLSRLGLQNRANHFATQLSGGEQQRVAIARALVTNADIILADEPTGNLQQEQWEIVLNLLEEQWQQGKTIVIVTHDSEVASRAKRVVKLRDGQLAIPS